ncbi:unnamed protein product [Vitrella brassicaformis CCMP3155]|uniref:F-box domain-containing protein n=2 Tax=Vitrella brassicaformis TaxID=1169539 RepID=A0A0G4H850_VITBC|nr:unnamed protein product [Vitrella brassicaformis CCMP3155]|eukprot:CEM40083.1 unnamed protein product [Vitrella brassicaformis CCMP3155]
MDAAEHLEDLPAEILDALLSYLPAESCAALRSTSDGRAGCCLIDEAFLVRRLNKIIKQHNLESVLAYEREHRRVITSAMSRRTRRRRRRISCLPRVDYLLRLVFIFENGGDWGAVRPMILLAYHHGWLKVLPLMLSPIDVQEADTKATYLSRCEAVRQYSLFGHRLRQTANGWPCCPDLMLLEGLARELRPTRYSLRLRDSLTSAFKTSDPRDPVSTCCYSTTGRTFRELIIFRMQQWSDRRDTFQRPLWQEARVCVATTECTWTDDSLSLKERFTRAEALLKGDNVYGCRTVDVENHLTRTRLVIFAGDQVADRFAVHLRVTKNFSDSITLELLTTEATGIPSYRLKTLSDFEGTAPIVRQKMGKDGALFFGKPL